MTLPYKLQVKVGSAEFSAEGAEETVKEQFQLFLTAVGQLSAVKPVDQKPVGNGITGAAATPIDQEVMARFFLLRDDLVTLTVLPVGESRNADALLLLLYGFQVLQQAQDVSAFDLKVATQLSGLGIERIDRIIAPYVGQYVLRGGAKKSTRYGLNNQGRNRAMELLRQLQ